MGNLVENYGKKSVIIKEHYEGYAIFALIFM